MEFTCPICGEHRLEEIMTDVVVASIITNLNEEGDHDYGEQVNEDGEVDHYQCVNCGWIIKHGSLETLGNPITDVIELAKWIKKNCPQGVK